jgi:acyl-CoA synthetase (AMP-forming)/AMP-acid ligase II
MGQGPQWWGTQTLTVAQMSHTDGRSATTDNLIGFVEHNARSRPDDIAIHYRDRQWSWAEWMVRIRQAAGALRTAGVARGGRVAFLDKNHPACLETFFAAASIGASVTVINWRTVGDELAHILNDSAARLLLVGAELYSSVDAVIARATGLQRVVVVGGSEDQYETFLSAATPVSETAVADDNDIAVVMYSSGTTGRPKGVLLSYRALVNHTVNIAPQIPFVRGDKNLVAMPLFHVGGICSAFLGIRAGVATVVTREPDVVSLVAAVDSGATHAFLVPTVIAGVLDAGYAVTTAMSGLRYLLYGAAPMSLPLLQRALAAWPAANFIQVYGQTEVAGAAATLSPADHRDSRRPHLLLSAGKASPGSEIQIVDPASGDLLPTGQSGEIWVRSDQRMNGYLNQPQATTETVTVDGWLRTGDIGHLDSDNYLYVDDRLKDMIITGGENVYGPEVERVIMAHPAISDAAVIGVPDDRWGESVMAIVVRTTSIDAANVVEFCRRNLASYKCPRMVEFVPSLPRNASGKILKTSLREPYWRNRKRAI